MAPKVGSKNITSKYDWDALKTEWISTNKSLNQFREEKGIGSSTFYQNISREEWEAARKKVNDRALEKTIERTSTQIAKKWADYSKLWNAVKTQAAHILKATQRPDGKVVPLRTGQLVQLTMAIETALKSERLIDGESTENVHNKVDVYNAIAQSVSDKKDVPEVFDVKPEDMNGDIGSPGTVRQEVVETQ